MDCNFPATNWASLIHLPSSISESLMINNAWFGVSVSLKAHTVPENRVGWCCLPLYYGDRAPSVEEWKFALAASHLLIPQHELPINSTFDPIRVAKILEPTMCSKAFYPAMKKYFFSNMVWEFTDKNRFLDVVRNTCRLPGAFLRHMKHMSANSTLACLRWPIRMHL